jgi:hypothetical protein
MLPLLPLCSNMRNCDLFRDVQRAGMAVQVAVANGVVGGACGGRRRMRPTHSAFDGDSKLLNRYTHLVVQDREGDRYAGNQIRAAGREA